MGIQNRLEAGAREYGDTTYKKSGSDLAGEIEEELLDVCGWSFFLWLKIQKMKGALEKETPGPAGE